MFGNLQNIELKMNKILVTGSDGSAAQYLIDYLNQNKHNKIYGISRKAPSKSDKCEVYQGDLCDQSNIIRILKVIKPDYIFHLAANADVRFSFDCPQGILNNNINNTITLFEGLRTLGMNPNFMMCSTSEVYGAVKTYPITEDYPFNPANIYAISKLTQENIAKFYYDAYKMNVVISRAFGYINPKRKNIFSTAFAIQIAKLEKSGGGQLFHGNLDSIRTLLDVRDIAKYYAQLLEIGEYGQAYNIGSDEPVSVGDILNKLISLSTVNIELVQNPDLLRPNDVTLQIPDVSKFKKVIGFTTKYSLDESLQFLMDYARENYV